MRISRSTFMLGVGLLLAGGLLLMPLTLISQEEGPGRWTVRIVTVKPDSAAGFEAALKDVAAIQEEAGRLLFHVYERVRGGLDSYAIITQDGAYVDLPAAPLGSELVDRLVHSEDNTTLLSLAFYGELGINSGSLHPPGEYMRVRVRRVPPANADAYFAWHRDELTPALREAGLNDLRAGRVMLGGDTNTFVRYTYSDSLAGGAAGLDIPGTVGQREFDRIIARERALLSSSEDLVYRFREDLSFTSE